MPTLKNALPPPAARPWLMAASLWLAMAAVVALVLWHLWHETLHGQQRELGLLSLASTDAVERGLRGAEEGLHALRAELEELHLPLDSGNPAGALQTRAALMPLVQTVWVLDAQGGVIASSDDESPPAAADFVPSLATLQRDGLALGRSIQGPVAGTNGRVDRVALAVPFAVPRGRSGWVVSAMPSAALLGSLGGALPAADARMLVLRRDGALLAGDNAVAVGSAEIAAILRDPRPGLARHAFADGSDNLVDVHPGPRYGLNVLVSREIASVLGTWRQAAELAAVALVVMLLLMAGAVVLVQRADRRRTEAQAALQAQVSRAGKLESLGTLAGGVAHDFNNVLAAIVGFGEMAQDAAAPGSAQARHLDKVMQAALRGKALVERILAFSRGGARSATVFELEPVVEEVLTLLSASLRSGIVLERLLEAPGARLKGDATQAFEAVMNLCTNAMQAMPKGGMLSVRLERATVETPRVLSHTRLAPGRYIALSVADQGDGISSQVMEHLFEPFFTTKAAQSGTGLGLAVVFGVVTEFGGAVDVQSRPTEGARFTLYLPECTDEAAGTFADAQDAGRGAGQRLLVLDDEPELVALTVEILQRLGYAPEGYTDPVLALRAVQDEPHGFAAVITDEVMPGLTGTQFTQALRAHAPRLPVLLLSGYGGAMLAQRASMAGVNRVLAKPVQRAPLAHALAEVLSDG
jgi:signal transduction histidine kinase/CheY-like chemotaxis protein